MPRWLYQIDFSENAPLYDDKSFREKTNIDNVYSSKSEAENNLPNIFSTVLSEMNKSFETGDFVVKEICKQGKYYFKCLYRNKIGWYSATVEFRIKTFNNKK